MTRFQDARLGVKLDRSLSATGGLHPDLEELPVTMGVVATGKDLRESVPVGPFYITSATNKQTTGGYFCPRALGVWAKNPATADSPRFESLMRFSSAAAFFFFVSDV